MPIIKLSESVPDNEALQIIQSQGFTTIFSITKAPDGKKYIIAE